MATATITPILPTRSRDLLDNCHRLVEERLPGLLAEVLTQSDDVLFNLANTAGSSNRQNLYFDAMRELRLKRNEIEQAFIDQVNRGFAEVVESAKGAARRQVSNFGGELSLVALDEVEENLAVSQFTDSMKSRCGQELFALEKRLAVLFKVPDLDDSSNPIGPRALGDALKRACQRLDSEVEVKLTLYKLFDKHASAGLQQLYAELNRRLVQGDILPMLSGQVPRSTPARKTRVIIESADDSVEASGEDVFSTLQSLMQPGGALAGGAAGGSAGPSILGVGALRGHGMAGGTPGVAGGFGMPGVAGVGGGGAAVGGGGLPGVAFGNAVGGFGGAGLPDAFVGGNAETGSADAFPALLGFDADAGASAGASGGGYVPLPALLETLTSLQRAGGMPAGGVGAGGGLMVGASGGVMSGVGSALPAATNVLRGLRESGAVGQMAPTQDLTLEIVSLLFDYILNDASIPDALKALLGRLQIPVLKVAILDKNVFSKKNHPARRLLDALGAAAVGWHAGLQRSEALYDKIEAVVHRIVNDFDDDVALFAEVLADFTAFMDEESAAATARAEASSRSLHTREQLVLAKFAVDEALHARTRGVEVREFIQQFLFDYWRQLLIITHVEEGTDSDAWRTQLAAVDELIWSAQAKGTAEDRKALSARLPALLKTIKAGMRTLEMAPADCSRFLSMLASVHVVAIKQVAESSLAARKLERDEQQATQSAAEAHAEACDRTIEMDPASEEFIRQGLARLFERKGVEPLELDIDFSAFDAPAEPVVENDAGSDEIEKYVELITTLDLGDWVEFVLADGQRVRGRFTWISPNSGRYLFTDLEGEKMRELTMMELAREFQFADATIIRAESDPLLDRALGALIERLEAESAAA